MRLRSRNILNENTPTPSRRRRAAPESPSPQTPLVKNQVSPAVSYRTLDTKREQNLRVFVVIEYVIAPYEWSALTWLA